MRRHALAVGLVAFLVGCGSAKQDSAPATTRTTTATTTATATATETATTAVAARPTRVATSGGITLRVLDVRTAKTVSYKGGTQDSTVTPDAKPRTRRAPQGGHYVYVATRVKNNTGQGIDMTCGLPITAALVDAEGNNYDPIDGLYLLRGGNPGCNAKLQPGFRVRMTWVFLVPRGTQLDSLAFTDSTDLAAPADTAQIIVP